MPWTRWAPCSNTLATTRRPVVVTVVKHPKIRALKTAFLLVELRGLEPLTRKLAVWGLRSVADHLTLYWTAASRSLAKGKGSGVGPQKVSGASVRCVHRLNCKITTRVVGGQVPHRHHPPGVHVRIVSLLVMVSVGSPCYL